MGRSWLELVWPSAGIDRAAGYQNQPPFTTPDAKNVRTDGMRQYRMRGGSRPGLGLALRTQLPGKIRLLTKVSVIKATWPRSYSHFAGTQLRDTAIDIPWAANPSYIASPSSFGGIGATLNGSSWGVGIPAVISNISSTKPYEISVHVVPTTDAYDGTVNIYLNLPSATTDPTDASSNAIRIGLVLENGTYKAEFQQYTAGVPGAVTSSSVNSDNPNAPGIFSVSVSPGSGIGAVAVHWRHQTLLNQGLLNITTNYHAVEATDASISATKLAQDWTIDTTTTAVYDDLRRDVLVAVSNGQIWMEDSADSMKYVNTSVDVNSDVDLVAVDREQKLYIADYGTSIVSEGGTIAGPDYNEIVDASRNFTALGATTDFVLEIITSDYSQNEKQSVTLGSATGGTFRLSYKGQFTTTLAFNAAAAQIQAALSALSTIDSVSVTGDPGAWVVEFTGEHAASDVELLEGDATLLTHDEVTPTIQIVTTQEGAGGEFHLGQYEITGTSATNMQFKPPLKVAEGFTNNINSVKYQVVRAAKVFDPKAESLVSHRASKGFVPGGSRLVALYRDRIVYAGGDLLPHVWYMSRQGDPDDWDYSQEDSGAAVAAQSSVAGQLADPITALIAHGDECLIFGCYNSLWICRGDPGLGGTIDQLSRKVGIVGAHAWCRTPDDMCVFMSPDGLYVMPAGCAGFPQSLSRERLPDDLLCLNSTRESIHLEYDTVHRGVHIFVTKRDGSASPHWWFDWETKSFWRVEVQSDHEPYALHERIAWSDCPVVLVAGQDGYIRYFDRQFQVDDGNNTIDSYCDIGPFHLDPNNYTEGILAEINGVLGVGSGDVTWEVRSGHSAEEAHTAAAQSTGTWSQEGLNHARHPRVRGVSAMVRVKNSGTKRWFLERVTAALRSSGKRRV